MAAEQRLDRIESILERITEARLELENTQENTTVALNRFVEETGMRGRLSIA